MLRKSFLIFLLIGACFAVSTPPGEESPSDPEVDDTTTDPLLEEDELITEEDLAPEESCNYTDTSLGFLSVSLFYLKESDLPKPYSFCGARYSEIKVVLRLY